MNNIDNKINRTDEQLLFEKEIGKWLKKTRLSKSKINPLTGRTMVVTQSKLAKHLGVTFQQVQKYEGGANGLGLFKFRQCCVFFNTDPRDVLEIVDVEMWNKKQHPIIEINKEQNAEKVTTKVSSYQALASGGYNEAINKEQNVEKD